MCCQIYIYVFEHKHEEKMLKLPPSSLNQSKPGVYKESVLGIAGCNINIWLRLTHLLLLPVRAEQKAETRTKIQLLLLEKYKNVNSEVNYSEPKTLKNYDRNNFQLFESVFPIIFEFWAHLGLSF